MPLRAFAPAASSRSSSVALVAIPREHLAIGLGYRPPTVTSVAPLQFLILLVASWIGRGQGEASSIEHRGKWRVAPKPASAPPAGGWSGRDRLDPRAGDRAQRGPLSSKSRKGCSLAAPTIAPPRSERRANARSLPWKALDDLLGEDFEPSSSIVPKKKAKRTTSEDADEPDIEPAMARLAARARTHRHPSSGEILASRTASGSNGPSSSRRSSGPRLRARARWRLCWRETRSRGHSAAIRGRLGARARTRSELTPHAIEWPPSNRTSPRPERTMRKQCVGENLCVLLFTRGWAVDEIV
jgi:hypothetical protein